MLRRSVVAIKLLGNSVFNYLRNSQTLYLREICSIDWVVELIYSDWGWCVQPHDSMKSAVFRKIFNTLRISRFSRDVLWYKWTQFFRSSLMKHHDFVEARVKSESFFTQDRTLSQNQNSTSTRNLGRPRKWTTVLYGMHTNFADSAVSNFDNASLSNKKSTTRSSTAKTANPRS